MLYIVLILVLAALGLLVTALITVNSLWAWLSIGLSVLAGVILVVDFLRRRAMRSIDEDAAEPTDAGEPGVDESPAEEDSVAEQRGQTGHTEVLPTADKLDGDELAGKPADEDGNPVEEQTNAADLLVISKLDVEVVVVDEYPRYHLTYCHWLVDRDTLPITVSEARDLGFTPCARCGPDAKLTAEYRSKHKSAAE